MRKIEIGGGTIKDFEYEQLDIVPGPDVDIICDATQLGNVYPEEFDEIFCQNVIEHFPYEKTVEVLHSWWKALKPGGLLVCNTPLLLGMIEDYLDGKNNFQQLVNRLYGGQSNPYDFHYAGFDENLIEDCFILAGFINVTYELVNKYSVIIKGEKP